MILEKSFNLKTFTHSATAEKFGIDNTQMTDEQLQNLQRLHEVLTHIQSRLSIKYAKPIQIKINSGFRSKLLNEKVGGVSTSQHSKGEAADTVAIGISLEEYFDLVKSLVKEKIIEVDQCIDETTWVHISFRKGKNRNQFLKMRIINGKTQYTPG
ncbi:D-Ala-D-Ala carboxypeptidase family metallohydrolase [Patescibacteria group bacterium]|nr:D-Ala-D-Ala carboxypeptidase family metallohydrolase [Patescibacteria group bacterium]